MTRPLGACSVYEEVRKQMEEKLGAKDCASYGFDRCMRRSKQCAVRQFHRSEAARSVSTIVCPRPFCVVATP